MSKINLSFEFDEEDASQRADLYLAAPKLLGALCDIMQTMRSKVKYGENEVLAPELEAIYSEMWDTINSHGVGELL